MSGAWNLLALSCLVASVAGASEPEPLARSDPHRRPGAQHLSLQWLGLSIHGGPASMPHRYPLGLDPRGYVVLQMGASVSYDVRIRGPLMGRVSVAHFRDCVFLPAGYFHIGLRGILVEKGRHTLHGGLGPTLIYREDWRQFPDYPGDEFYGDRSVGRWQYRFIVYGGEFEYLYRVTDRLELQASLIPGIPLVFTTRLGVRWAL